MASRTSQKHCIKKVNITGPTWLTLMRMGLSVVCFSCLMVPELWTRIAALVLFVMAAITDKIDGIWARRDKIVTNVGAFLDPLADKMLVNLAFLALVVLEVVPAWVFAVILVRDFAMDGLRMMAAKERKVLAALKIGKWKTGFQMAALMILLLSLVIDYGWIQIIGNVVLYIALLLTVVSAGEYFRKYML